MRPAAFGWQGGQVLVAGMFSDISARRRAAEDMVRGLKEAGLTPLLFDLSASIGRRLTVAAPNACLEQELAELSITDVGILAPPKVTQAAASLLRALLSGSQRLVAFWDGPLDEPPDMLRQAAAGLDAIWAPTAHLAGAVLAALPDFSGEIDIVASRQMVPFTTGEDRAACRERLCLPASAFVVGAQLEVDESLDGQNPAGILAAFHAAFAGDGDAWLVLRCDGITANAETFDHLLHTASHPRVRVVDVRRHYLPCASLLRACDAWLTLPRDGADRADVDDALSAGLPVIACARGLSARGWRHKKLHPVRYTRAASEERADWVTPDIAHAATLLRGLHSRG